MFDVSGDTNSLPQSNSNPANSPGANGGQNAPAANGGQNAPGANGGQNDDSFNPPSIEADSDGEAAIEHLEEIIQQPATSGIGLTAIATSTESNDQSPDIILAQYCDEMVLELQMTGDPPSLEDRLAWDTLKYK